MLCFKSKKILVFFLVTMFASNIFFISETVQADENTDVNILIEYIDIPEKVFLNENIKIPVVIKNIGLNNTTAEKIHVYLKIDNKNISYNYTTLVLEKNESAIVNLSWKPTILGNNTLNFSIKYNNTIFDNTSKNILVIPKQLEWWNSNWHYRTFLMVEGSGNVSKDFNFTKIAIEDLKLNDNLVFENDTIRIIQYNKKGELLDNPVVNKFNFSESIGFNSSTNATGTLEWNISGSESIKFYYVYFDFKKNTGNRGVLKEKKILNITKANIIYNETEGWWSRITHPEKDSYQAYYNYIDFKVETIAKAKNINATVEVNNSEFFSFNFSYKNNKTLWIYDLFLNKTGEWRINISCYDSVGYVSYSEVSFFVKVVDLKISYHKDFSKDEVRVGDKVIFPFVVSSINASVYEIDVSFYVNYELFEYKTIDIDKKQTLKNESLRWISDIKFEWIPNYAGVFYIEVIVDEKNNIYETNKSNNRLSYKIVVSDWSDLCIRKLSASNHFIKKMESITISAQIINQGNVNSEEYSVCFFIKSTSMKFEFKEPVYCFDKNSKLKAGEKNDFSFTWTPQKSGFYNFGAEVKPLKGRDSNIYNNRLVSHHVLKVYEIDPPVINNVVSKDVMIEQNPVISADIFDETGLKKVTIQIFNPRNELIVDNETMLRESNNKFTYVFRNGDKIGRYSFIITAVDSSIFENSSKYFGSFNIKKDDISPNILFFDVKPEVQLVEKDLFFYCSAFDNIGIDKVELFIEKENIVIDTFDMIKSKETGVFFTEVSFEKTGFYQAFVIVKDGSGNSVVSSVIGFWITTCLDDTDNDGMPDWWEKKYGLDPRDPTDSDEDIDGDGYTNLEEYKMGTNPTKPNLVENALFRIKDNYNLIVFAFFMFLVLFFISLIGFRRRFL